MKAAARFCTSCQTVQHSAGGYWVVFNKGKNRRRACQASIPSAAFCVSVVRLSHPAPKTPKLYKLR